MNQGSLNVAVCFVEFDWALALDAVASSVEAPQNERLQLGPRDSAVCKYRRALLRAPGKSVVNGLRAGDRGKPSFEKIKAEHDAYTQALSVAGVSVTTLPALEESPDSIFIEDAALVFPEGAILLRPGAPSRAEEPGAIASTLRGQLGVRILPGTGTAEGGDVLVTPHCVLIGLSSRTNRAGAEALAACLEEFGRKAKIVATPEGVLHFKSDCSLIDDETVLTTARLAQSGVFEDFDQLVVPEDEEAAANALRVNGIVFVGAEYPKTAEMLDRRGLKVVALATEEIGKLDAGLSCMSLRW